MKEIIILIVVTVLLALLVGLMALNPGSSENVQIEDHVARVPEGSNLVLYSLLKPNLMYRITLEGNVVNVIPFGQTYTLCDPSCTETIWLAFYRVQLEKSENDVLTVTWPLGLMPIP